jgi:peptide/nickel transport system permease protein
VTTSAVGIPEAHETKRQTRNVVLWLIVRRVLVAIPMLLVVSFTVFLMEALSPGSPAETLAGDSPTPQRVAEVSRELGLNQPVLHRFWSWLTQALQGNLGTSWVSRQSVTTTITSHLEVTISLIVSALLIATVIGVGAGLLAAMRPGKLLDGAVTMFSSIGVAVPPFLFGLVLVLIFAQKLSLLPSIGFVPISQGIGPFARSMLLPALSLAALPAAEFALQLKTAMREVLRQDFILSAEARGLPSRVILVKHALRNALIPVLNVLGFRIAQLIGGTVTVEYVFSLSGIGTLAVNSVLSRDIPVLLGIVIMSTLVVLAINLLVDLASVFLNPKLRT